MKRPYAALFYTLLLTIGTLPLVRMIGLPDWPVNLLLALMDLLGIERLQASLGASYGGMVTLALAQAHPARVRHALVLSAAHRRLCSRSCPRPS